MSDLASYRAMERRHTDALAAWVDGCESRHARLLLCTRGLSVSEYISQYDYRFRVAADLAAELGHPDALGWQEDYYIFAELDGYL